jgi:hypothetical protein
VNNTYIVSLMALRRANGGVETVHHLVDIVDCANAASAKKVAEDFFCQQYPSSLGWRRVQSLGI